MCIYKMDTKKINIKQSMIILSEVICKNIASSSIS